MAAAARHSHRKPSPCYGRRVVFCSILVTSDKAKACHQDTINSVSDCSRIFLDTDVLLLRSLCAVAFDEDVGNHCIRHARRDDRA